MCLKTDAILYLQTGSAPYPFYNGVVGPMAYQPEAVRSGTAAPRPRKRPAQLGRVLLGEVQGKPSLLTVWARTSTLVPWSHPLR